MSRFFPHVRHASDVIEDVEGEEQASVEAARVEASKAAPEIAGDMSATGRRPDDSAVLIAGGAGSTPATVPFVELQLFLSGFSQFAGGAELAERGLLYDSDGTLNKCSARRNKQAAAPLTGMSGSCERHNPLVLVVDDEALLRLLAADVLEDSGYRVLEAANATAALEVLTDHQDVGVLFTDVNMPGDLDGIDLAREVHARWPHVKLVITSGRFHPTPKELPDSGRFVSKPYSPQKLLHEIEVAIAQ